VFPIYLKLLSSAITMYQKDNLKEILLRDEIPIEEVESYYAGNKNYPYLSSSILPFKGDRGKISLGRYNQYLRTYFGYEVIKKEGDLLSVRFL
jgi:hypothetical protein